jgi:hypothetical protein
MSPDAGEPEAPPEADRRISALRGVALIVVGVVVAIVYVSRDDQSWPPLILVGASFVFGAVLLAYAFRRQRQPEENRRTPIVAQTREHLALD